MEIDIKGNDIKITLLNDLSFEMTFEEMRELEQAIKMIRDIVEKKTFRDLHIKT